MQCPICQIQVRDGAQFCTHCGHSLAGQAESEEIHARPTRQSPVANIEPSEEQDFEPSVQEYYAYDDDPQFPTVESGDAAIGSARYPSVEEERRSVIVEGDPMDEYGDMPAVDDEFEIEVDHGRRPILRDSEPPVWEVGEDVDAFIDSDSPDLFGAPAPDEHTFRVHETSGAEEKAPSRELESILAQLQDDGEEMASSRRERREMMHDMDKSTDPESVFDDGFSDEFSDDGFEADFGATDEGFSFGDEDELSTEHGFSLGNPDEESGPIPVMPEHYEEMTNPPSEPRKSRRAANVGARIGAMVDRVKGVASSLRGKRKQRNPERQKQLVVAAMVAIAVIGIGYSIFSGSTEAEETEESTHMAAFSEITEEAAAAQEAEEQEAEFEMVRVSDVDDLAPEDPEAEAGAPSPRSVKSQARPDARFWEQNVLASEPQEPKAYKLDRSCILRAGPASKFRLVTPLDPGEELEILAMSTGDWNTAEVNGQWGWTTGCEGSKCTLRMGPGEYFRTVEAGDHTPKPTRRVVSSSRWRYVKHGDQYGWSGPACFK